MRRYAVWLACFVSVTLFAPLVQAQDGWHPITETIRKSEKDPRQYQAIKLDNGMTVLLVSDAQATKSLAALTTPAPRLTAPRSTWKWKTMRCNPQSIAWPMPLLNRCSTR